VKANFFLVFIVIPQLLFAQVTIQAGAIFNTTGDVNISLVNNNLVNQSSGTDLSGCVLTLSGNANSFLSGNGNWTIKKLVLNKPAAVLGLMTGITLNQQLELQAGRIDLNNQLLTLAPGATLEGENETRYVYGASGGIIQTSVMMNAPQQQNAGKLGAAISTLQNLGIVTVKRWHNTISGEAKLRRFFQISSSASVNMPVSLRFYYLDAELNNIPEASLALFGRTQSSLPWAAIGTDGSDINLNYVDKTGLTALHQFSLGPMLNPLPVRFGSVRASCADGDVLIEWTTEMEENLLKFEVQRLEDNNWITIGTVDAAGPRQYAIKDENVEGRKAYRIAGIDRDGKKTFSTVMQAGGCGISSFSLYPVPAADIIHLRLNAPLSETATLRIFAPVGAEVWRSQRKLNKGLQTIDLSIQQLPAGSYLLQLLHADGRFEAATFIKQ